MSCDNVPTTSEIAQAKKDVNDFNTFMTSTSDTFVDSKGTSRLTLQGAINKAGFGIADFTFTEGGILSDRKLLVSNDPVDGFLYRYVGTGTFPITVTAGTDPTSGTDWEAFTATSAEFISNANGGSVQDFIDSQFTTTAEVAIGKFQVGTYASLVDRTRQLYKINSGGAPNDITVLPAGTGKTAQAQLDSKKRFPLSVFGITPSLIGQSAAIQTAMEICAENNAWLQIDGVYWVESRNMLMDDGVLYRPTCLYIPSKSRIEFLPSAEIRQIPNNLDTTYVFNFYLKDDITIVNPVVYGDKDTHTGVDGEYGHCFNITSCSNVTLIKPKAYDAWGDCFYVGLEYQSTVVRHCEDVKIYGAEYNNASRNGISFTSGKNVDIELVNGGVVNRVPPKAGIDFEPEFGGGAAIVPTYENCHLRLNFKGAMSTAVTFFLTNPAILDKCDITIHHLKCDSTGPVAFKKTAGVTTKGLIRINNLEMINSGIYPINLQWRNDNLNLVVDNTVLLNSNVDGANTEPFNNSFYIEDVAGFDVGGFYFNKITRLQETKTPFGYRMKGTNRLIDFALNFDSAFGQGTSEVVGSVSNKITGVCSASYFDLNSSSLGYEFVELSPETADNISVILSQKTKFKQTYTKVNTTPYAIIMKPDAGKLLNYNGTNYAQVSSVTPGAKCEIIDDGSGNKILSALSGVWVGA